MRALKAWKLETGGTGRVIPPMRCDGGKVDHRQTPGRFLRIALRELGLARSGFGLEDEEAGDRQMLWYWCARHTFASQWVMAGGSIEKLKEMGHYSVVVTERYAHLRPEHFSEADHERIPLDLDHIVRKTPTGARKAAPSSRKQKRKAGAAL